MPKKIKRCIFILLVFCTGGSCWAGCDIDGTLTIVEEDTIGGFDARSFNTKARIQIDLNCQDAPDPVEYRLTAAFLFQDEWLTVRVGNGWRVKGNNIRQWFYQIPSVAHLAGHNEYEVCLYYITNKNKSKLADCDTIDLGLE